MANQTPRTIRYYGLFLDGAKFAELYQHKHDVNANSEAVFADGGWAGQTDGAVTSQITGSYIVPVDGGVKDPVAILLSRRYVGVASLTGGKYVQNIMKFTAAGTETNSQNGTATGTFTLMGGEPSLS